MSLWHLFNKGEADWASKNWKNNSCISKLTNRALCIAFKAAPTFQIILRILNYSKISCKWLTYKEQLFLESFKHFKYLCAYHFKLCLTFVMKKGTIYNAMMHNYQNCKKNE